MRKKLSKLSISLIALFILAVIAIGTYAVYKSSATGTSGFKAAAWYIELNGEDISSSNTFDFDLADANWTHSTNIVPEDDSVVVIAPGSYGTFGINIDATGADVDVTYLITAAVRFDDQVVDLNALDSNFEFSFYKDGILQPKELAGYIPAHGTYNAELRIIWNEEDTPYSNFIDLGLNDKTYEVEVTVTTSQRQNPLSMPICKRVENTNDLHKTICKTSSCVDAGYSLNSEMTFGTVWNGTGDIPSGAAFDCDVNADGVYNPNIERFYYVTSEDDYSVLVYYTNVENGITPTQKGITYGTSAQNWHGPGVAYTYLPTTEQWSNTKLVIQNERTIVNELGNNTTNHDANTIDVFDYEGKAARLLTYQEIKAACGNIGTFTQGELNSCLYLMENLGIFQNPGNGNYTYGYWTETPRNDDPSTIWYVHGGGRFVLPDGASTTQNLYGVRPAIVVLTSDIE